MGWRRVDEPTLFASVYQPMAALVGEQVLTGRIEKAPKSGSWTLYYADPVTGAGRSIVASRIQYVMPLGEWRTQLPRSER